LNAPRHKSIKRFQNFRKVRTHKASHVLVRVEPVIPPDKRYVSEYLLIHLYFSRESSSNHVWWTIRGMIRSRDQAEIASQLLRHKFLVLYFAGFRAKPGQRPAHFMQTVRPWRAFPEHL
jgi:hypothetical protein